MGRRRSNILQGLFEVGGMLPWWLTALLALGTYAVLHYFAVSDPVVATEPKEVLSTVFPNVLRNVAVYAQYIVPWLLIVGMLTSVLRRATGAQLRTPPQERQERQERRESPHKEDFAELACPRCKGRMVRRTAKGGLNAGEDFWGCSRFPACHGTRAMDTETSISVSA